MPARDKAVLERDAATDPAVKNAKGQEVVNQSTEIGELGGMSLRGAAVSRRHGWNMAARDPARAPATSIRSIGRRCRTARSVSSWSEAKGGGSPLGTRLVNGQVETQGTAEYFAAIANNMGHNMTGPPATTGKDLSNAYRYGKTADGKPAEIVYLTVQDADQPWRRQAAPRRRWRRRSNSIWGR